VDSIDNKLMQRPRSPSIKSRYLSSELIEAVGAKKKRATSSQDAMLPSKIVSCLNHRTGTTIYLQHVIWNRWGS